MWVCFGYFMFIVKNLTACLLFVDNASRSWRRLGPCNRFVPSSHRRDLVRSHCNACRVLGGRSATDHSINAPYSFITRHWYNRYIWSRGTEELSLIQLLHSVKGTTMTSICISLIRLTVLQPYFMNAVLILSFSTVIVRHINCRKIFGFSPFKLFSDGRRVKKINYYWLIFGLFSSI